MPIIFDKEASIFKLDTPESSYIIYISKEGYPCHAYFGKRIPETDIRQFMCMSSDFESGTAENGINANLSYFPFELAPFGTGNRGEKCVAVKDAMGNETCDFYFEDHSISNSKNMLCGMPQAYSAEEGDVSCLEIVCFDPKTKLRAVLQYTVFEKLDAIVRSVRYENCSEDRLVIERALSYCVDLPSGEYDMITLSGEWGRERNAERFNLHHGKHIISSTEGKTSHAMNSFFAVCSSDANENYGEVYGNCLIYSGNFYAGADISSAFGVRMFSGINPEGFCWVLESGDSFQTPEAALVYSGSGIGKMSRTYHDLIRRHIIRSPWKDKKRPVLINSWEAAYFDFNAEKLVSLARRAARCGIEMLVMDDGWFGKRNSDASSLGDWVVNEEKLGCSLKELVGRINAEGLEFGIWFEPEMVSPDSELYRKNPDWCLHVPDRVRHTGRRQLVLDLSREDVREYIFSCLKNIIDSANIKYIKWDHNRPLSEVGNQTEGYFSQMSLSHKYVLGLYDLQERLFKEYPELLIENCSAGGGRFDAGMLYYSPQIWTSDNCDPFDRLFIQEGTSLCYPCSAFGTHVAASPGHLSGRSSPFDTRTELAFGGTFGYELDITKLPEEYDGIIRRDIEMYKSISHLVQSGDYYRLTEAGKQKNYFAWMFISKDKKEALFQYVRLFSRTICPSDRVKLSGLDPERVYEDNSGRKMSGAFLMNHGIVCDVKKRDFSVLTVRLKAVL